LTLPFFAGTAFFTVRPAAAGLTAFFFTGCTAGFPFTPVPVWRAVGALFDTPAFFIGSSVFTGLKTSCVATTFLPAGLALTAVVFGVPRRAGAGFLVRLVFAAGLAVVFWDDPLTTASLASSVFAELFSDGEAFFTAFPLPVDLTAGLPAGFGTAFSFGGTFAICPFEEPAADLAFVLADGPAFSPLLRFLPDASLLISSIVSNAEPCISHAAERLTT
jgi:hypothetical protein